MWAGGLSACLAAPLFVAGMFLLNWSSLSNSQLGTLLIIECGVLLAAAIWLATRDWGDGGGE